MPLVSAEAIERAKARRRNRDHIERSSYSDITLEQEAKMRRRTRKCRECGIYMTGKPGLPNSKHLDHIIPICIGGTHTHGNVRIICAACNLKRPKDGSDYFGPVTLWAQGEIPVSRPRARKTCRKGGHPWTAENVGDRGDGRKYCIPCQNAKGAPVKRACKCGTLFAAPGRTMMCPDCMLTAARMAAFLHLADGLGWAEIAAQVGYGTAEGARFAAKRIGYAPAPRPRPVRADPRACPDCGLPRPKGAQNCRPCTEAKAWQVVRLRQGGWTLRMIADELGYTSITSVTSLIKAVMPIEPRMGRPRKSEVMISV